jgi:hypothetical protein
MGPHVASVGWLMRQLKQAAETTASELSQTGDARRPGLKQSLSKSLISVEVQAPAVLFGVTKVGVQPSGCGLQLLPVLPFPHAVGPPPLLLPAPELDPLLELELEPLLLPELELELEPPPLDELELEPPPPDELELLPDPDPLPDPVPELDPFPEPELDPFPPPSAAGPPLLPFPPLPPSIVAPLDPASGTTTPFVAVSPTSPAAHAASTPAAARTARETGRSQDTFMRDLREEGSTPQPRTPTQWHDAPPVTSRPPN